MSAALWQCGATVIGCRDNTAEFVEKLLISNRSPSGIVTIDEATAAANHVPAWADLKKEFSSLVPVFVARSYKLADAHDRQALQSCRADVGFCIGWQRLLPEWFLDQHRNGVFGMHACANRLPNGRGRSPINWSVIEGASRLHAHIFRYNDQPDAGDLLSVPEIRVEPHDDIQTLQQKARVVFGTEVLRLWDDLVSGTPQLMPLNSSGEVDRFYPKRSEEDGVIDWSKSSRQITDWVRAQTRPYPGAFTLINGTPHRIWRCGPTGMRCNGTAGTVLEQFRDGTCFVACGDGESVHLLQHELPADLKTGRILGQ